MTVLELVQRARDTGDWGELLKATPYAQFLGVEIEEVEGALRGRMRFAPHLVGNPTLPALHGGTLGALMELAAQFEVLYRAESAVLPKTVTITIDYLRSAKPVDTYVRARAVKQGRRVSAVQCWCWQEDEARPIAAATVHLLVMEGPKVSPG
jgi:uncharacterized protein (TIGR00369 family)